MPKHNNEKTTKKLKGIPLDWDHCSHKLWVSDNKNEAIQSILKCINSHGEKKPRGLILQFAYYLYLTGDFNASAGVLEAGLSFYSKDEEIISNLIVSLSRGGRYEDAREHAEKYIKLYPSKFLVWDSLANIYFHTKQYEKATLAGTTSLRLKDEAYGNPLSSLNLPFTTPEKFTENKKKVIAFSLWGSEKRYLYGALRNLILAPDLYNGWELWFYLDNSVPQSFITQVEKLGGKVLYQKDDATLKEKLCWRFNVANAIDVGYFLIRDVDSVMSFRERNAVENWLESDQWFHIIRDWWTHTDLILAGLWGGVANVLPDLSKMLSQYESSNVETPNIDQWFLRDCVWRYIKTSCLVHDRCFSHNDSLNLPSMLPDNDFHVGCCEFSKFNDFQIKMLSPWLNNNDW